MFAAQDSPADFRHPKLAGSVILSGNDVEAPIWCGAKSMDDAEHSGTIRRVMAGNFLA